MCGITGALDLTGLREFNSRQLLAMTDAIAHRGPDDEQIHIEPGVALGVRRLSILDIHHGHQPVTNETQDVWATFNGELFNYTTLKQELVKNNHSIKTNCDTELWVHLYEDLGEALFKQIQGQFAISLWDRKNRTLILARDRVGICPLYYAERNGWLLWGSEIKALLASGLVSAEPDPKGIDYFFNFSCASTTRTFFSGIKSLPPGHYLQVKNGRIELHQYWDFDFPEMGQERIETNPSILVDELEALLNNAVKNRLRSEAPVACYISGGIDSTTILSLSGRQNGSALPSFTIGLENGVGPDERSCASESAALLGSKLTTVTLDSLKLANAFPELILAAEGPVLDTSCAALMLLATEVHRQGYKVALTGEGADEALAGYIWFKTQKISERINNRIGPTALNMLWKLVQFSISSKQSHSLAISSTIPRIRQAQHYMYEAMSLSRERLYSHDMWSLLNHYDAYADLNINYEHMKKWHPLNQSLYIGYKVMLPGLLMMSKGDRIAMHSSVEMRYPFLDEEVIRFCASISPMYKLHGMTDKWLLRQVAAKNLPNSIANRPKTMFRAKLSNIFIEKNRPAWVDQLLSTESLRKTGYFNPEAVQRERLLQKLPRILPRQYVFDAGLTCVISTQLWHHLFCGGGLCDLPQWKNEK